MKKRYEGTVEENNIEELPDDFFTRAKPASEALPEIFGTETARKLARKSNNSAQKDLKVLTKIRLDAEVLEVF